MLRSFKRAMTFSRKFAAVWGCGLLLAVAGCQSTPKPEDFFEPVTLEERTIQTRLFETDEEIMILNACADLLLDNGFQIGEVESRLGWVGAFKVQQFQGMFRRVAASIVTRKVPGRPGVVSVRVIFYDWLRVEDPAVYQEFFIKLSQAVFLEAQPI